MEKTGIKKKTIRFSAADLNKLVEIYRLSKLQGGFGAFIASRILGKTEIKGTGWISLPDEPKKETKSLTFGFRCTETDKIKILNYYNQSTSKSLSDFFIQTIQKSKIVRVENRVLPADQMRDLNQIGHNVNQIARKTNSLRTGDYNDSILREIREELNKISSELHKLITP